MNKVGIEKINIYGTSMFLDQRDLAESRGKNPDKVVSDFLINARSLNPPYEDTVTMGANAARPMLTAEDTQSIGMLIVGTEGSVDFGKPISTNIHGALGLPHQCRNYETKHACFSGIAALDTAINWVASGLNKGKKALVIATDFSRAHLGLKEEFVMGGLGAAVLVSNTPKIVEFEVEKKGTWTTNIYDTFRPSAIHEVGNNETSLYTYIDALEGSYQSYLEQLDKKIDFDTYFDWNIYHTPFAGMAMQAHRTLCNVAKPRKKKECKESFDKKVWPSLRFSRRIGSTYGASNFAGIASLLMDENSPKAGDRIGIFTYGSGAIGEFYSAIICQQAVETVKKLKMDEHLDARRRVSVKEYEMIEKLRETYIEQPNITPDFNILDNHFEKHYKGKNLFYLKEVKDFYRTYEWS